MKYVVNLNGKNYEVEVNECEAVVTNVTNAPAAAPVAAAPVAAAAAAPAAPVAPVAAADGNPVVCPMPGTILDIKVQNGQAVKAGDVMFILEAMKMENDIVAPVDGVVKQIIATKGSTVDTDEVLAVI